MRIEKQNMKQEIKDALEKQKQLNDATRYVSDAFDSSINILEQKGFDEMLRQGIIVRTDKKYEV